MTEPRKPGASAAPDEDVWDAMAHGDLSSDEVGFLRALAEADPARSDHPAAFTPISSAAIERTALAAERSLAQHRRRQRALRFGGAAGVLAVAAAVLLMVRSNPDPALLAYELSLSGGVAVVRGPSEPRPDSTPSFEADTELDLVAAPATRVEGKVEARVYLVRGTEIVPLPAEFEQSEGGALRWRGPAGKLLPRLPGRYRLAVVVGRALPDDATTRRWVAEKKPEVMFHELVYLGR